MPTVKAGSTVRTTQEVDALIVELELDGAPDERWASIFEEKAAPTRFQVAIAVGDDEGPVGT